MYRVIESIDLKKNAQFTSAVVTVIGNFNIWNDNSHPRTLFTLYFMGFLADE